MPTYTYKDTKTGKTWEELRRVDDRLNGVDGVNVILVLSMPRVASMSGEEQKRLNDFQYNVLEPAYAANKIKPPETLL